MEFHFCDFWCVIFCPDPKTGVSWLLLYSSVIDTLRTSTACYVLAITTAAAAAAAAAANAADLASITTVTARVITAAFMMLSTLADVFATPCSLLLVATTTKFYLYGGFYFVCDHGKYRKAKRYNFGCNRLFVPPLPVPKVTPKIVPFSNSNSLYDFMTRTNRLTQAES